VIHPAAPLLHVEHSSGSAAICASLAPRGAVAPRGALIRKIAFPCPANSYAAAEDFLRTKSSAAESATAAIWPTPASQANPAAAADCAPVARPSRAARRDRPGTVAWPTWPCPEGNKKIEPRSHEATKSRPLESWRFQRLGSAERWSAEDCGHCTTVARPSRAARRDRPGTVAWPTWPCPEGNKKIEPRSHEVKPCREEMEPVVAETRPCSPPVPGGTP